MNLIPQTKNKFLVDVRKLPKKNGYSFPMIKPLQTGDSIDPTLLMFLTAASGLTQAIPQWTVEFLMFIDRLCFTGAKKKKMQTFFYSSQKLQVVYSGLTGHFSAFQNKIYSFIIIIDNLSQAKNAKKNIIYKKLGQISL